MPYPFAHPAAILPLVGHRRAAPSALVIGCVIPDAWYFLPELLREDTHSLEGLVGFCLPAAVLTYLAFHLLLKQPLLALLPKRLAARLARFAAPGLPAAPWPAVLACLLIGAATHVAWDAVSHAHRVLQHASTLLGTAYVAAWLWRRLSRAPAGNGGDLPSLPPLARTAVLAVLVAASAGWALWTAAAEPVVVSLDSAALRHAARTAGLAAAQALAVATLGYALLWKLLR